MKLFIQNHDNSYIGQILLCFLFVCACHRSLPIIEFEDYLNDPDNGLIQEKTVNHISYQAQYQPGNLFAYQELSSQDSLSSGHIKNTEERYGQHLYFKLSVSVNGRDLLKHAGNQQQFGQLVNQLAFRMSECVNLVTNKKDTLALIDQHFTRLFELATTSEVLLVFEKKKDLQSMEWIRLDIKDMGLGTGELSFRFKIRDIDHLPDIKY